MFSKDLFCQQMSQQNVELLPPTHLSLLPPMRHSATVWLHAERICDKMVQPNSCTRKELFMETVVIERSIVVTADRERVWQAITAPEHIAHWFEPIRFERLAVGEALTFSWGGEGSIALVEPMERFGFRWQIAPPHPAQTLVIFALETVPEGTRITVTEQGFEALPDEVREIRFQDNVQGWEKELGELLAYLISRG